LPVATSDAGEHHQHTDFIAASFNMPRGGQSRGQIMRLRFLEPFAGAPLTVGRPSAVGKPVANHVVRFDAERVAGDLGGLIGVVAVDRMGEEVGRGGGYSLLAAIGSHTFADRHPAQKAPRRASRSRWW